MRRHARGTAAFRLVTWSAGRLLLHVGHLAGGPLTTTAPRTSNGCKTTIGLFGCLSNHPEYTCKKRMLCPSNKCPGLKFDPVSRAPMSVRAPIWARVAVVKDPPAWAARRGSYRQRPPPRSCPASPGGRSCRKHASTTCSWGGFPLKSLPGSRVAPVTYVLPVCSLCLLARSAPVHHCRRRPASRLPHFAAAQKQVLGDAGSTRSTKRKRRELPTLPNLSNTSD
jgi:hypothetical protein